MMRNPRVWPNAAEELGRYLILLLSVPVRQNHIPAPRPDRCVVVRRVGTIGSAEWIDRAVLDVEVWGGRPGDGPNTANALAAEVRELLYAMPEAANPVTRVIVSGPDWLPDPESGAPRVYVRVEAWLKPTAPM